MVQLDDVDVEVEPDSGSDVKLMDTSVKSPEQSKQKDIKTVN